MKTDRELLHDFCRRRSQPAFRELVERHLDWVYSVALRQVGQDRHLAEDVCQEVFASVSRKAEQLGELDALNGWLFRATRFAASDVVRAERRRKNREWEAAKMDLAEKAGGSELDWQETGALLDEAIGELRDEDRDALCLRFFEERSFAEVGARLGVQENAARMRVNRALDKLQLVLQQRGVKSTAAALGGVCAGHSLVSAPASLLASVSVSSASAVSGIGLLGTGKVLIVSIAALAAVGIGFWVAMKEESAVVDEKEPVASSAGMKTSREIPNAEIAERVDRRVEEVGSENADLIVVKAADEDDVADELDFSFVVSEEGIAVVSLRSVPISGTKGTRVFDIEGGANYKDGLPLVLSEEQAEEIKEVLLSRLSGIELSEMAERTFKKDLGTVVEDDLSQVLGLERELRFRFTKLVVR
ncbi:sigma-70 family RNA polymerase sigma factor [Pelagicoccus enzymogenes]|uniref:RNA polymerase sigma factor n=1 Tax=Pelagicoccus enzymogenes TaxID=2773457 RepID=UPI00280DA72C|nr:sigma-70 family RNA polymerase sigma factor [Pelagicoccus enzymogenes]MDQ8199653.1 sigma-70 family RNA polymerase sigma factor [Pelagicoccus enzymogenes]